MKKFVFIFIAGISSIYSQAQLVNPTACDPTDDKSAQKALEKTEKMGGLEKVKAIHEILKESPDFYEAIFSQGMTLVKMNKYAEALARFLKVDELCPEYSPYTWFYIGAIYYGSEEYAKAIPFLKKYLDYSGEQVRIKDEDVDNAKAMLKAAEETQVLLANKVSYNPQPVRNICTELDEYTANLTPDNETMYFIRKVKDSRSIVGYKELFMESKNNGWVFDRGQELPPPFNMSNNNGAATITADNKTMYFVVCQNNEYSACDIWYTQKTPTGWTTMSPVPGNLNQGTSWESCPSVSFDGKEIVFASNREGGYGGTDLYISRRMPDGTWSQGVNLGPQINTSANENTPFLHSDSKTLYFASKGHNSLGGYDIFYSRQQADGTWSKPTNLGSPINTKEEENSFFVSLDGKRGFFASKTLQGPGGLDVFTFALHEEARPQAVKMIKGEIKSDMNIPRDAQVEIKNLRTKEVQKVEVDQNDGKYVTIIDAKEDYVMTLKKEGMAFSSQLIEKDVPVENGLIKADLEMKKIETGKSYNINNINFATNSAELTFKSKAILEGFSDFLKTNPKLKVTIQGHTDDVGDDEANLLLSENRAKAVLDYLVSTGVSAVRLSSKGYGETQPVADNGTEVGRAKNRRTEILITAQ